MPENIPTPTKPCEVICFYPVEFPTQEDGDVYAFIAVDVVSTFLFQIGMERSNDINTVLNNIRLFMKNKDFEQHKPTSFTLVLHKHEEHRPEIEHIIKPYGGKVAFNDAYLSKVVTPVVMFLYQNIGQRQF